ncbi:integrase [Lachnoclostridium sp. An131]|uniref:tyrosine-type recombinase/integrase n=1 Tax=Lachnoclostridium sp. An131 TaxID=1965555 RepID=UPI000B384FD0|nr:tyrosine-type recombinase/integrase [Lachnoclostridium sp. An131]OUQ27860.1 integrase [Lachnoclostridium sp. An131]
MEKKTDVIRNAVLEEFREYLMEKESSALTMKKYMRDVKTFFEFAGEGSEITKEMLLAYKEWLLGRYAVSSANSMIAALNQFLSFQGLERLKLKRIRVQRADIDQMEKMLTREEFRRLVRKAREDNRQQLAVMMETMGATGVRVSELKFFCAENVRSGMVKVWNKGKYRLVILPAALRKRLLFYMKKNNIRSGLIFRTRTGKAKNRSNIWKEMKTIAGRAEVSLRKVFPHNLRHLFARTFYKETKNMLNLADILGHSSLEVTRIYASDGLSEWKKNIERVKLLEMTT